MDRIGSSKAALTRRITASSASYERSDASKAISTHLLIQSGITIKSTTTWAAKSARAQAFVDTWVWDERASLGYDEIISNDAGRFTAKLVELIKAQEPTSKNPKPMARGWARVAPPGSYVPSTRSREGADACQSYRRLVDQPPAGPLAKANTVPRPRPNNPSPSTEVAARQSYDTPGFPFRDN